MSKITYSKSSKAIDNDWDIIIDSKSKWFDFQIGEVWRARELIWLFVWRDLVSVYKQTVLGFFWFFLQPIFQTLIYYILFGLFARFPTDGIPPLAFYLSGLILWGFFSACFGKVSQTFIGNIGLYGKVYFPRLVIPISLVISSFIGFLIQTLLLIVVMLVYIWTGTVFHPNIWLLSLPVLFFMVGSLGFSLGIITSVLTIRFRDLQHFIAYGLQFLLYATPIIYPLSVIPEKFQKLLLINPLTSIFVAFRYAVLGQGDINLFYLGYSFIATLIILFVALVAFKQSEGTFMDFV
jgi:lipopolysaccharide transport system permease protein